ncbi:hypothetical protein CC85DRAFT_182243 [Cutaneotrichosporon oleaginosum]|uniref:Uncharacterized protein n=1 Tax=Cutaneotrichosporon oleaginosum TaxID=879819 RepID=A0A0J0XF54_9TREE|nr:uncharacterized protein CC85DRAFT_182243 [Cutaneotrichosporon oleaginosum]KLT39705.1 hypothetical protein CC85DRAFT_182243 [Cutaneotrichosporon oleaginosum]TXT12421.1 hypothetical protein COLE_02831 [Cutaneotrichosporon oleaginosum]
MLTSPFFPVLGAFIHPLSQGTPLVAPKARLIQRDERRQDEPMRCESADEQTIREEHALRVGYDSDERGEMDAGEE